MEPAKQQEILTRSLNPPALESYLLLMGDNALILGQRIAEWCGHGPVLEQDIAITNISLDLIGQARNFYQYLAIVKGHGETEDKLAFLRNESEFRNCLLVELPCGDWAKTILRQFFFSTFQFYLYAALQNSVDVQLTAIAIKAMKEVKYHLRWSSEWVIRLGDGTDESHMRIKQALLELWPYTGELFLPAGFEIELEGQTGVHLPFVKKAWEGKIAGVFAEANLTLPETISWIQQGGKEGRHTEHLGHLLTELQYLQRTYPGCEW